MRWSVCASIEYLCDTKSLDGNEREREAKDARGDEKRDGFALQRWTMRSYKV